MINQYVFYVVYNYLVNSIKVVENNEPVSSLLLSILPHQLLNFYYLPKLREVALNNKKVITDKY